MPFRNLRWVPAQVAVLAGSLLLVSSASATTTGTLLTGSSGTATLSLNGIVFNNDPAAAGGGNANVSNGTSLTFSGCAGVLGTPGCLSVQEGVTVNNADLTLSAPSAANANTFLTFAAHPNLVFSINWPPGPGSSDTNCATANANGLSCSLFAGSPIILTFDNSDTFLSLGVRGHVSDTGVAGLATGSLYTGGFSDFFTSTLPNGMAPSPLNIQLFFCPGVSSGGSCTAADFASGRSITSSQSGSFSTSFAPVPEPGTLTLFGSGLFGLVGLVRRKLAQT